MNEKDIAKVKIYINNIDLDKLADIVLDHIIDQLKVCDNFVTWFDEPEEKNLQSEKY